MDNLHTRTYMMRIGQLTEQTTQSTSELNERSGSIAEEKKGDQPTRNPHGCVVGQHHEFIQDTDNNTQLKTREELF